MQTTYWGCTHKFIAITLPASQHIGKTITSRWYWGWNIHVMGYFLYLEERKKEQQTNKHTCKTELKRINMLN